MTRNRRLPLYQEVLLLALDEKKGTTPSSSMFAHAMGGAILAEFVAAGLVRLDPDKKKLVRPGSGLDPEDPILAESLALVRGAKRPKQARDWVMKFAGLKDLKHRAAALLADAGVLEEETGSVLKIFKRRIYPEADPGPETELRDRMHRAVFTGTADVEPRTVVIIALARATGMLDAVFGKKKLKERKQRLDALCSGQAVGAATKEAVEAVQAAIMVATIVPVIAAGAATTGR